jgi:RNA polymerase sigma-70 factor (ECF subfamily)
VAFDVLEGLWREAEAGPLGLNVEEFADTLLKSGEKANYGLPPGRHASPAQVETFWRGLRLHELAVAYACALGRDAAWTRFFAEYREPLTRAAVAITGSSSLGQDLADALYSELFGLTERDGERRSPLASYSGRGSLMGWLRTTLAQRHVDHHRKTHRETPLEHEDFVAATPVPAPSDRTLVELNSALRVTMSALDEESRFMLAAWFLDGRTLLQIARLLRVHEATVSRKVKRLTEKLRKDLLKNLQAGGLSRQAAEEALGTDPRDLGINLRSLLQTSESPPFLNQKASQRPDESG